MKFIDKLNIKYVLIKELYKEYKMYFEKLNLFDFKIIGGSLFDDEIFMEK